MYSFSTSAIIMLILIFLTHHFDFVGHEEGRHVLLQLHVANVGWNAGVHREVRHHLKYSSNMHKVRKQYVGWNAGVHRKVRHHLKYSNTMHKVRKQYVGWNAGVHGEVRHHLENKNNIHKVRNQYVADNECWGTSRS